MEKANAPSTKLGARKLQYTLRQLETRRIQAILARDMPLLWQLHSPDYQLVTPAGRTYSRERYLGDIESNTLRYLRWAQGDMEVRACAQMAIIRYQATLELDSGDGTGTPFLCWHTDSYELRDGVWQAVCHRLQRSNRQNEVSAAHWSVGSLQKATIDNFDMLC